MGNPSHDPNTAPIPSHIQRLFDCSPELRLISAGQDGETRREPGLVARPLYRFEERIEPREREMRASLI